MSQAPPPPCEVVRDLSPCATLPGPADAPTPWLVFLLVWGLFYLAEPLDFNFSNHELLVLEETDLTTMDRVERNIEHIQSGSLGRQASLAVLGLFGVWLLLKPSPRRLRIRAPLGEMILVFLAWCGLTIFWSDLPVTTLRRLMVLGCLCLAALGMARAYPLRHAVRFALFSGALVMTVGVACEIALGNFHPWHQAYRFSGLCWPAFSAWNLGLLVLAILAERRFTTRRRLLDLLGCWAFVMVVLTKTRAGLGAATAGLILHLGATWPARRWGMCIFFGGAAMSLTVLVADSLGSDLGRSLFDVVNLGRTESVADVSGRAGLWNDLLPYLEVRPLNGYGYDTFWTPARLLTVGQSNWGAPDAHNSYLNLSLGIGLIGSGLCVLILLLGMRRAWVCYRKSANPDYLFACEALVVLVVNAGFISTMLAPALYSFATMLLLAHLGFAEELLREEPART